MPGVTDRVTGKGLFEAYQRDDISGPGGIQNLSLFGVHFIDTGDVFLPAATGIENPRSGLESALINPHKAQVPVNITGYFEDQADKVGSRITGYRNLFFFVTGLMTNNPGSLQRRRKKINDAVKQLLHTNVFQSRPTENRLELIT